ELDDVVGLVQKRRSLDVQDLEDVHEGVDRNGTDLQRITQVQVGLVVGGHPPIGAAFRQEEFPAVIGGRVPEARNGRSGSEIGGEADAEVERRDVCPVDLDLVAAVVRERTAV